MTSKDERITLSTLPEGTGYGRDEDGFFVKLPDGRVFRGPGSPGTHEQKLIRDIETLKESIRIDFAELGKMLNADEANNVLKHVEWCKEELKGLTDKLQRLAKP